jgi:NADPH2:quinone reductase
MSSSSGRCPTPTPGPGELRIQVAASGINPGDVKKRRDEYGYGMPYPRVVPHSDGAGVIDQVGEGIAAARIGERVWCFGAQSYRPFGTAADYCILPAAQAIPLPRGVPFEQGASLGIPGITAHRAVHVAGPVAGRWVLVQGAAGAVGQCAVRLAAAADARVIGIVRRPDDIALAQRSGARHVVLLHDDPNEAIRRLARHGVQHIVEVAFGANIALDTNVLAQGGSIAAFATDVESPSVPFWPLLFKNAQIHLVGSDDVPPEAKADAAQALNEVLADGWEGLPIEQALPLEQIVAAHELVEAGGHRGRIVLTL